VQNSATKADLINLVKTTLGNLQRSPDSLTGYREKELRERVEVEGKEEEKRRGIKEDKEGKMGLQEGRKVKGDNSQCLEHVDAVISLHKFMQKIRVH